MNALTIEQIVDIPRDHRLVIAVPPEVPSGLTILSFTPADAVQSGQEARDLTGKDAEYRARKEREPEDLALINRDAPRLNAEALDVLSY